MPSSDARSRGDRGGFAVAATVLLLTVVVILGVTGYQMVSLKGQVERGMEETVRVQAIARAGLARYMADTVREVGSTVTYDLFDGQAVVSAQRVAVASTTEHYLVTSAGTYTGWGGHVARKTYQQYASRTFLMAHSAPVVWAAGNVTVEAGDYLSGYDAAASGACLAPAKTVAGIAVSRNVTVNTGGTLLGSPQSWTGGTSYSATLAYMSLDWEAAKNATTYPADYTNSWPSFSGLAATKYPVIRYTGNHTVGSSHAGRGLLIVIGTLQIQSGFSWNGVILAGNVTINNNIPFQIRGMLVGGLETGKSLNNERLFMEGNADIRYHRCHVNAALAPLAPMEPAKNTQWEVY